MVGSGTGGEGTAYGGSCEGTMTVVGKDIATLVTCKELYVGTDGGMLDTAGVHTGTGTLEFQIASDGVTPITTTGTSTYLGGTANLLVSLLGTSPTTDIVLVDNTDPLAVVSGLFTSMNGGSAAEGASILLGDIWYTLTYKTTGALGTGNDIVLLVPEPATIALFSLGLIALRRNKK
jgi:hypothetical protein